MVGGYFQLADFLNRLETLTPTNAAETGPASRAVLVMSVSLSPGGESSGAGAVTGGAASGSTHSLTAAVSMIAFQSTKEPAATTTTPGQSGTGTAPGAQSTTPPTTTPGSTQTPAPGTPGSGASG